MDKKEGLDHDILDLLYIPIKDVCEQFAKDHPDQGDPYALATIWLVRRLVVMGMDPSEISMTLTAHIIHQLEHMERRTLN
jgi:hypothetical protein